MICWWPPGWFDRQPTSRLVMFHKHHSKHAKMNMDSILHWYKRIFVFHKINKVYRHLYTMLKSQNRLVFVEYSCLRDGHFGLVAVLVSGKSESDSLAIGGLPANGSLWSGASLFADFLLGAALSALDAISGLESDDYMAIEYRNLRVQDSNLREGVAAVLFHVKLIADNGNRCLRALRSRSNQGNHSQSNSKSQSLKFGYRKLMLD